MQILLINANTSADITQRVLKEARLTAAPGTQVTAVAAGFGPRLIRTRSDNAIAAYAALTALAKHHSESDAVVLAVSTDTGLAAMRECSPIPVVGMTEASLLTACMLGGRFGVLVFDRRALPVFRELVAFHGLTDRVASLHAIDMMVEDFDKPDRIMARIRRGIDRLIEDAGAESVVITGATMAGTARALQGSSPVPLLDGISCAVLQAEALVRLKLSKPKIGSYVAEPSEGLDAVDPALIELLRRP